VTALLDVATKLVAGWIGIVSAARRVISPGGSSADGGSSNAYRHPAAYGCTAINAGAMDAAVIDSGASNATSSICEGVS